MNLPLITKKPEKQTSQTPSRGFEVSSGPKVPAIGDRGITTQSFCPLIQSDCLKNKCMLWVELFLGREQRVAHCAYYWNTIQATDIKGQLINLNKKMDALFTESVKEGPHAG